MLSLSLVLFFFQSGFIMVTAFLFFYLKSCGALRLVGFFKKPGFALLAALSSLALAALSVLFPYDIYQFGYFSDILVAISLFFSFIFYLLIFKHSLVKGDADSYFMRFFYNNSLAFAFSFMFISLVHILSPNLILF